MPVLLSYVVAGFRSTLRERSTLRGRRSTQSPSPIEHHKDDLVQSEPKGDDFHTRPDQVTRDGAISDFLKHLEAQEEQATLDWMKFCPACLFQFFLGQGRAFSPQCNGRQRRNTRAHGWWGVTALHAHGGASALACPRSMARINNLFDILHSWYYRFELGLCCDAITFCKSLQSEHIWDVEKFTFITQLFGMVWATVLLHYINYAEGPAVVACQMIAHVDMVPNSNYFPFLFFPWRRILHSMTHWVRFGTGLITCESELYCWVSRMPVLCWVTWVPTITGRVEYGYNYQLALV